MDQRGFSKYFKAFGDPTRLKILTLLASKEMSVGEIVTGVELSQPAVSRHLAILRETGILTDRREGQNVYYSLNKNAVEDCCSGFCECLEIPMPGKKTEDESKES